MAELGITRTSTYAVCRIVDYREDSEFFLTTGIMVIDERTLIAAGVAVNVVDREYQGSTTDCEKKRSLAAVMEEYRSIQKRSPHLRLFCVENLDLKKVAPFIMADFDKHKIRGLHQLAEDVGDGLVRCLRG